MRVGVVGGSFNPPHLGHLGLIKEALKHFDEVWVVPTFQHSFGKTLEPFSKRIEMCQLLIGDLSSVKISGVEKELASIGANYTYKTLSHLLIIHPEYSFSPVLGGDIKEEVSRWAYWKELEETFPPFFINRRGYPGEGDFNIPEISSSQIREALQQGSASEELIPKSILEYIETHKLY